MIRFQAPRGTEDTLPEEQPWWRFVETKAANTAAHFGYERIDTPTFEEAALFSRSVGKETDIIAKETYTFLDRAGQSMTLRPEGTAPVCRAILERGLLNRSKPIKLFYLCPVFRYDRPQAGRLREHHQFGYEAIGEQSAMLDAEVIDLAYQFYIKLGLKKFTIYLNSIGCKVCRSDYIKALKEYYSTKLGSVCPDCKIRASKNPMRLLDCKKKICQPIIDYAPQSYDFLCEECFWHFKELRKQLDQLGIEYKQNHRLVRGLDYYTKTVFEFQPEGASSAQSTIGGGGRYDELIEMLGGPPTPAIGFATGLERIILNLKKQGIIIQSPSAASIFISSQGINEADEAFKLANSLRRNGIGVIQSFGQKSLKAQLRQANSLGVMHVIIIGEKELSTDTVILRDMASSSQKTVSRANLIETLCLPIR
jgi:histidyl-tRNA synthetase